MQADPQRAVDQLLARIDALAQASVHGERLNDLAARKIHNDLLALYNKGHERAEAAVNLALLASIEVDRDESLRWSKIAARLIGPDRPMISNLLLAALRSGHNGLAYELYQRAVSDHIKLDTRTSVSALTRIGRFREAATTAEAFGDNLDDLSKLSLPELRRAADYLASNEVDDELSAHWLQLAAQAFMEQSKQGLFSLRLDPTIDGLLVGFPFHGSDEDAVEIDWAMLDAMRKQGAGEHSSYISFVTLPAESFVRSAERTQKELGAA